MTEYKIVKTVELAGMPNPALAKDLLERLRLTTAKVVENRKWRVPVLKEFYPKNRSLLGLNVNRGKSIMIRLREGHDQMAFLPWESVLGTLVHELTHNEIGEHSAEFYKTMEKVYDEVDATSSTMGSLWGPRIPAPKYLFDGKSAKVGGGSLARTVGVDSSNVRQLAAEAAMRRLGQIHGSTQVLGGAGSGSAKSRKELFLEAEERRRSAETLGGQGCSVVKAPPPSGSARSVTVVAGEPEAQLREDLGAAEWRWVCQVCTEENISRRASRSSGGSSSSSRLSAGAVRGDLTLHLDGSDALCGWCGCAYGSSLQSGGDDPAAPVPPAHKPPPSSAASKRPSSDEDILCIDCDSPVQRKKKSSDGARAAQFVDLVEDDANTYDIYPVRSDPAQRSRASGSKKEVMCEWTNLAMLCCPCCAPAPAAGSLVDRANGNIAGSSVDVIVLD